MEPLAHPRGGRAPRPSLEHAAAVAGLEAHDVVEVEAAAVRHPVEGELPDLLLWLLSDNRQRGLYSGNRTENKISHVHLKT